VEPEQNQSRLREISKEVQSSIAVFAYLGPPFGTKEFYASEFISQILGAGESSLFYKKLVRQTQLLSSISVGVVDLLYYSVFYIIYPLLDLSKEREVKSMVLEELKKGIDQALSPKSLEKVKNIYMNNMIYSLKRSRTRSRILLDYEINFNDYKKMYEKLDVMEGMSPDFIRRVGEKYLTSERLNYLILKAGK
ncbi:MAG: insulinase family protein, partial [Oligoflexia bacterium]|nr:insulinase family protein [Oligoflexia bacterium]